MRWVLVEEWLSGWMTTEEFEAWIGLESEELAYKKLLEIEVKIKRGAK